MSIADHCRIQLFQVSHDDTQTGQFQLFATVFVGMKMVSMPQNVELTFAACGAIGHFSVNIFLNSRPPHRILCPLLAIYHFLMSVMDFLQLSALIKVGIIIWLPLINSPSATVSLALTYGSKALFHYIWTWLPYLAHIPLMRVEVFLAVLCLGFKQHRAPAGSLFPFWISVR